MFSFTLTDVLREMISNTQYIVIVRYVYNDREYLETKNHATGKPPVQTLVLFQLIKAILAQLHLHLVIPEMYFLQIYFRIVFAEVLNVLIF